MKSVSLRKTWVDTAFRNLCLCAVLLPLFVLCSLVVLTGLEGRSLLQLDFVMNYPHEIPAGILPAMVGSLWLVILTAILSVPLGFGAAIYLEEYADNSWRSRLIAANIANLAAVPSVIYGLLGLSIFIRILGLGHTHQGASLIAGACTLSLLIMPIIVVSSREALRTVPIELREAGSGLGATQWQTIQQVVLPLALPGMLTGSILALSRAIGEAAPLLVLGAVTFINFLPDGLDAPYSALPIQIFDWLRRPNDAFIEQAAAAIIVLLGTMLTINGVAVWIRYRLRSNVR